MSGSGIAFAFAFCVNAAIDVFPVTAFDDDDCTPLAELRCTATATATEDIIASFARFERTMRRGLARRRGMLFRLRVLANPHTPLGNKWLRAKWNA